MKDEEKQKSGQDRKDGAWSNPDQVTTDVYGHIGRQGERGRKEDETGQKR